MYEIIENTENKNENLEKLSSVNSKVNTEIYTSFKITCLKKNIKIYEGIESAFKLFIKKYS